MDSSFRALEGIRTHDLPSVKKLWGLLINNWEPRSFLLGFAQPWAKILLSPVLNPAVCGVLVVKTQPLAPVTSGYYLSNICSNQPQTQPLQDPSLG